MNNSPGEVRAFKVTGHFRCQLVPKLLAAASVNPLVPDNREFMYTRSHENQNAISFPRLFHAQFGKVLLGC